MNSRRFIDVEGPTVGVFWLLLYYFFLYYKRALTAFIFICPTHVGPKAKFTKLKPILSTP